MDKMDLSPLERWALAVRNERDLEQRKAQLEAELETMKPLLESYTKVMADLQANEAEIASAYEAMRQAAL